MISCNTKKALDSILCELNALKRDDVSFEKENRITKKISDLTNVSVGLIGDVAASINRNETVDKMKKNLFFSAYFFDLHTQLKLNEIYDTYFSMLGAAAYYLCGFHRESLSLLSRVEREGLDLEGNGLEHLLYWLLKSEHSNNLGEIKGQHKKRIEKIYDSFVDNNKEDLFNLTRKLRISIYNSGTPRELLLVDVVMAILKEKNHV